MGESGGKGDAKAPPPLLRSPGTVRGASGTPPYNVYFLKFKLFYNNVTIFERIWPCFCGKIFV